MPMGELRRQFVEAVDRKDWVTILELGEQLHARGDFGRPMGVYAYWMETAAGSLGHRWRALRYSRLGLGMVESGTALEAEMLANGTYTAWVCGQPNRAIRMGRLFLEKLPQFPAGGQAQRPRVLHHMAMAHEDRRDFSEAIDVYTRALAESVSLEMPSLATIIRADLALAILRQGGLKSLERAEQLYSELNETELSGRGLFAYLVGQSECLRARSDFAASNAVAERALALADEVSEAMNRQRAHLQQLRARNCWSLGQRYEALAYGLAAAKAYEGLGIRAEVQQCEIFLREVCSLA